MALDEVDYDDPSLLGAYPFHTAHDGYAEYAKLQDKLRERESLLEEARKVVEEQAGQLAAIEGSLGWRALRKFRRIREAVLPAKSPQGKLYRAIRRSLR
jgi:hypothetical protein